MVYGTADRYVLEVETRGLDPTQGPGTRPPPQHHLSCATPRIGSKTGPHVALRLHTPRWTLRWLSDAALTHVFSDAMNNASSVRLASRYNQGQIQYFCQWPTPNDDPT